MDSQRGPELPDVTANTDSLTSQSLAWPERARGLACGSHADYQECGSLLLAVRSLQQKIHAEYDEVVQVAHRSHKTSVAARKRHLDPLHLAEEIIKRTMLTYRLDVADRAQKQVADATAALDKMYGPDAPPVFPSEAAPSADGITVKSRWDVTVEDKTAFLEKARLDNSLWAFVDINEKVLTRYVRTLNGHVSMPGIRIEATETLAVHIQEGE